MHTCQVCGKDNPAGVEYCEDCGAVLTGAGPGASQGSATSHSGFLACRAGRGYIDTALEDSVTGGVRGWHRAASARGRHGGECSDRLGGFGARRHRGPVGDQWGCRSDRGSRFGCSRSPRRGAPVGGRERPVAFAGERCPTGAPRSQAVWRLDGRGDSAARRTATRGPLDPETGPVDIDLSSAPEAEHVSRQHGDLYREADGRWFVRDLGSTNGVFVKGQGTTAFGPRISAPHPLDNGDEVAFGNARFVFRAD